MHQMLTFVFIKSILFSKQSFPTILEKGVVLTHDGLVYWLSPKCSQQSLITSKKGEKHLRVRVSKILAFILIFTILAPAYKISATGDINVVEGRIKDLHDPIDDRDAVTKRYVDNQIEGIPEPPAVLQTEGQSETAVMSQKAVTTSINEQWEMWQDHLDKTVNKKLIWTDDRPDPNDITLKTGTYIPKNVNLPRNDSTGILENKVVYNADGSLAYILQYFYRYRENETWVRTYNTTIAGTVVNAWSNWINTSPNSIFDKIYPVGSIYMSVSSTNPGNLFGGTWVAWGAGRVPIGVDTSNSSFNNSGKTGGSNTHRHSWRIGLHWFHGDACGEGTGNGTGAYVYSEDRYDGWGRSLANKSVSVNKNNTNSSKTVNASGKYSQGDTSNTSTLQPYVTCYMWRRTA